MLLQQFHQPVIKTVIEEKYPNDVRIIVKNNALPFHNRAMPAVCPENRVAIPGLGKFSTAAGNATATRCITASKPDNPQAAIPLLNHHLFLFLLFIIDSPPRPAPLPQHRDRLTLNRRKAI